MNFDAGKTMSEYLVMTSRPGYWGRAQTVKEAVTKSRFLAVGDEVEIFRVTPGVYVNELGNLCGKRDEDFFIHIASGRVRRDKSVVVADLR